MSRDIEDWLDMYYDHFGQSYPLMITATVDSDAVVSDIRRCIETDTPAKEFEYDDGLVY